MQHRQQHVSEGERIVRFDLPTENYVTADRFQVDSFTDSNGITIEIITTSMFDPAKAMPAHITMETVDSYFIAHDLHGEKSAFLNAHYSNRYQPTSLIQPILDGQFTCRVGWLIYRKDIPIETVLTTLRSITNEIAYPAKN
jgi:hypothetical protein